MKVFLVPNYYKNEAVESGLALELWLSRQGYEVAWAADQRSKIVSTPDIEGSDLVISLGGDGTLLRAARIVGYQEIPILGLSYGHLGFLTAASPDDTDILSVVSDALAGEMHVSRRATLAIDVFGDGVYRLCAFGGRPYRKSRLHRHGVRAHCAAYHSGPRVFDLAFRCGRDRDVARSPLYPRCCRRWRVRSERCRGRPCGCSPRAGRYPTARLRP